MDKEDEEYDEVPRACHKLAALLANFYGRL
jgi:hypothetical protein